MSRFTQYIEKQLRPILSSQDRRLALKSSCSWNSVRKHSSQFQLSKKQNIQQLQLNKRIWTCDTQKGQKRPQRVKNLFYENMFMEEKIINEKKKQTGRKKNPISFSSLEQYQMLMKKLQEIKITRIQRENYLYELVNEADKLEKILSDKIENQQKYLTFKDLERRAEKRLKTKERQKSGEKKETRGSTRKTIHSTMSKHRSLVFS